MITKNFKQVLAMLLLSNGSTYVTGLNMPVVTTANVLRYLSPTFDNFPCNNSNAIAIVRIGTTKTSQGIYLGTGTTPPTENDYFLERVITTGLTAPVPTKTFGMDTNGNPFLQYTFTVTNTTSDDIVVSEIGYVQQFNHSSTLGSSCECGALLLDHTLLETPLTVPANDSAAIKYRLTTVLPS